MYASRPPLFGAAPGARKVVLSRAARDLLQLRVSQLLKVSFLRLLPLRKSNAKTREKQARPKETCYFRWRKQRDMLFPMA